MGSLVQKYVGICWVLLIFIYFFLVRDLAGLFFTFLCIYFHLIRNCILKEYVVCLTNLLHVEDNTTAVLWLKFGQHAEYLGPLSLFVVFIDYEIFINVLLRLIHAMSTFPVT